MGMAATESQFHVLAVNDSLIDRKLIERLLKTSSYQVTTVDSGSKALEFLGLNEDDDQTNPPHIPTNREEAASSVKFSGRGLWLSQLAAKESCVVSSSGGF
ncbi:hypothetical protein ACOSQ4_003980 [Xanthoceras sorbifolium]